MNKWARKSFNKYMGTIKTDLENVVSHGSVVFFDSKGVKIRLNSSELSRSILLYEKWYEINKFGNSKSQRALKNKLNFYIVSKLNKHSLKKFDEELFGDFPIE